MNVIVKLALAESPLLSVAVTVNCSDVKLVTGTSPYKVLATPSQFIHQSSEALPIVFTS